MPIQFYCPACHKPIEIDDEFGNQSVTCPYCRQVVTAPASGQITPSDVPAASPLPLAPSAPPQPNGPAVISFVCAILIAIGVSVSIVAVAGRVQRVLGPNPKQPTPAELQKIIRDDPRSATILGLVSVGVIVLSLVGLVSGIVAVTRRTGRRGLAVIGLTVCGLSVGCCGLQLIFGMLNAAQSGAGP